MGHALSDDRLAWLAMREYCAQQSRKTGPLGVLGRIFTVRSGGFIRTNGMDMHVDSNSGGAFRAEGRSEKMLDYSFAVDDCAKRLNSEERQALRSTGTLPDWFEQAVEERLVAVRRNR